MLFLEEVVLQSPCETHLCRKHIDASVGFVACNNEVTCSQQIVDLGRGRELQGFVSLLGETIEVLAGRHCIEGTV
jgi:hypothetical protein